MPLNAYVPIAHGYKRAYDSLKIYRSRQEEREVEIRFAITVSMRTTTAVT